MPAVADPSALANSARCFTMCVPPGMQSPLQTYLVAVFAGADTSNPSALANLARCFFSCIPLVNQLAVQNYLLAVLAGTDISNPSSLANQGRCFETCLLDGSQMDVSTYLFALVAGLSTTDPGVLSNRARCFQSCIPNGEQLAVQNYLLAQLAVPNSSASEIENAARCFTMCIPGMGQRALRTFLLSQSTTCTAPPAPTNLTIVLVTDTSISFSWTQPLQIPPPTITRYEVKWGTTSGVYTNVVSVSGSATGYSITGLNPATAYFIVVEAFSGLCGSGNSAQLSTSTSGGLDPVATEWQARVIAHGGSDPVAYVPAVSDLIAGLKSDGLWAKMIIVHGYVPGPVVGANPPLTSCYAPLTPFLVGPGVDPWINRDGTSIATAMPTDGQTDITINGFKGYNDTPKVFPNAIWSAAFDVGFSTYTFAFSPAANSISGADDYNTPHRFRLFPVTGGAGIVDCGQNDIALPNAAGAGLISVNRSANNNLKVFIASSTIPPATLLSNAVVDNTDPRATNMDWWIHGVNDPAGGNQENRHILSFAACHQALTLAEFTLLFNRVQTFRQTIGGGFV